MYTAFEVQTPIPKNPYPAIWQYMMSPTCMLRRYLPLLVSSAERNPYFRASCQLRPRYSTVNYRRAINDVMILEGGHKALKFNGLPLVRNKFLAPATIDMYDTSLFTIDQIDDWDWLDDGEHGILQRNAGYATYEGSIAKYCNLMCRLPAGIGRLSGITAPGNPMSVTVNNEITPSSSDNSGSGSGGSGSGQG